jgi:hypothetical protein
MRHGGSGLANESGKETNGQDAECGLLKMRGATGPILRF